MENRSCPLNPQSEVSSINRSDRNDPNQLLAGSSPRTISDPASSLPVWIEDEDAECIADCDERAELPLGGEFEVRPEDIMRFQDTAIAFLDRCQVPLCEVPQIERRNIRKIEQFDISQLEQARSTQSMQSSDSVAFKAYRLS